MKRKKLKIAVGAVIAVTALSSVGITAYASSVMQETAAITEEYDGVIKETTSLVNSLKNDTAVAEVLLDGLTVDDVTDPSVLTDLEEAITAAEEACTVTVEETEYPANPFTARKMAEADLSTASASLETITEVKEALSEAIEAVSASIEEKQLSNARASLEETITQAQELADSAANTISETNALEALETAIADAQALLDAKDTSADDFEDVESTVTSAMSDAEEAVEEAEKAAEEAAKKAAEEAAAEEAESSASSTSSASSSTSSSTSSTSSKSTSSSSSSSSSEDIWYCEVAYSDYSATSGDANGALTQWRDGYYIAHSNSANGKKIASKPTYVVVNGQKYKYVSSKVVSTSTTWSQIESYVHANNGIGFQTCTSGGYLVTHYEPV